MIQRNDYIFFFHGKKSVKKSIFTKYVNLVLLHMTYIVSSIGDNTNSNSSIPKMIYL